MRLLISRLLFEISNVAIFLLNRGFFLIAFLRAAFCRVLACACEARHRLCVYIPFFFDLLLNNLLRLNCY